MSLPQQKLSDSKAKSKFQSLPINTIYQGAASKVTSSKVPQKHGLQSLGKVPTARRAPANLPSVKSEKGGNDPNVVLVPTGGSGWNSKEPDTKHVEKQENLSSGVHKEIGEGVKKSQSGPALSSSSGPKTWSSVTGARQARAAQQFGHEFPSLRTAESTNSSSNNNNGGSSPGKPDDAEAVGNQVGRLQLQSRAGKDDLTHGNGGPMLRPQTFGNWTQGGGKGAGTGLQSDQSVPDTKFPIPQPHKPTPPSSSSSTSMGSASKSASSQFKAIMPHYMDVIEPPVGLSSDSQRRISRDRHPHAPPPGSRRSGDHLPHHMGGGGGRSGPPGSRPEFTPPSIIDKEKLRRMDDLAGDDWTYDDDNFDYNKRLQSDDEENESEHQQHHHQQADPNWADQVEKVGSPGQYAGGYYDEKKGYDESQEERRRNKKSEEVRKNIDRARKRREEEENRYRRPGSSEVQRHEENGHGVGNARRYDDKDMKSGNDRRGDWTSDDKMKMRGQPPKGRYEDRRSGGGRYDDRQSFDSRGGGYGGGHAPHRYEPRKEDKDDYRTFEDIHHKDEEYKPQQFGRKERNFEDNRDRNRSSEERSFSDYSHHEENSLDSGVNQRSPAYSKHGSRHISGDVEIENGTSEWGAPRSGKTDWTEELEMAAVPEQQHPSRPNSRDSRVSKDSKEGKNARNSMERSSGKKLEQYVDSAKMRKQDQYINELDQENKKMDKKGPTDMRNYFGDVSEDNKKIARAAPAPITREKLEASNQRDNMGMTQLKKRDVNIPNLSANNMAKPDAGNIAEQEVAHKLNPLVDSDMYENISDDDDGLLDSPEKEDKNMSGGGNVIGGGINKGRGGNTRGRGIPPGQDKRVGSQRGVGGTRGMDSRGGRGERGSRGGSGRGDNKSKPRQEYYSFSSYDESEESKKNKKNLEKGGMDAGNQPPAGAFMPRGQPSRRGRGDGRVRGPLGRGGGGRHYNENGDEHEIGDWGDDESNKGRGGKIPPRMQRKRDERKSRGEGDDMMDEWENESENSGEDKRKRDSGRGGRGGGRGWDSRGGGRGRGGMMNNSGQMMGPGGFINDNREQTPESEAAKKRTGIDNIDLHDFAGVVVVDQETSGGDHEMDGSETGEFMQVVNKKTRPPMGREEKKPYEQKSYDRPGMKMNDNRDNRGGNGDKYGRDFNKQNKMYAFEKRKQLPPRLAKVREESRAQARTGGVSPSSVEQNGWPEGDKMGVFQVDDLGTNAWEKTAIRREKEGSDNPDMRCSPKVGKENGVIQQTLVFENTSMKSCKDKNALDKQGIQLPVGLGKPEDNLDVVKLDFFGGDEMGTQGKPPLSIPRSMTHLASGQGIPPSPSTDDLTVKIANTKKLWDSPGGMAGIPENTVATSWNDGTPFTENSGFEGFQDHSSQNSDPASGYDKQEGVPGSHHQNNVQKVKPVSSMSLEQDNRPNNPMQFNRLAGNTMPAIPSPPTQLNQMGTMPQSWGYQLDRTSNMYNPYNQSILMAGTHSIGTDLFTGSNGAGGYRLQNAGHGHYPGTQQSTANMISQASIISGGVKHSNQIGPIGTKAGTGASTSPYLQPGLGTLSNTFIQYDASNFNFVNPTAAAGLQRGNAPPTQTAFYQRQPQLALNAAIPGSYNHALSAQQQLRAANHVASLPFMKNDLSAALSNQQKNQLGSNDFGGGSGAGANFGNGAANNRSVAGGPASPKTKMKLEQHQQQQQAGVTAASLNQLVQMSRMGLGFNMGMAGVQPGYPSPIARPQMGQGTGNHGLPGKPDYYNQEGNGEEKGDADKSEAKEGDSGANDKGDTEQEAGESVQ